MSHVVDDDCEIDCDDVIEPTVLDADMVAERFYDAMKAHSPARLLYDAVQAAANSYDRLALLQAASSADRAAMVAYATRRAALARDHAEYAQDVHEREDWLAWMRRDPATRVAWLKRFYRNGGIAEFVDDWGWTLATKRANSGRAVLIPFRLWPRQASLIDWMWKHYLDESPAVCAKAREVGASWVSMAFAAALCVLYDNIVVAVFASTEEKLDSTKDPSPTLPKAREFLRNLPPEFAAGYDDTQNTTTYLKVQIPSTNSLIRGFTGTKHQGRGSRAALAIVDESAFFQDSFALDAAVSAVAEARLDFSSANGTGNSFFTKASDPAYDPFYFSIDDDPRRGHEWQEKKRLTLDPLIWEQEYKVNFHAQVENQLIPWAHVESAIGLAERLSIEPTGRHIAALDVSDQGRDMNAWSCRYGIELQYLEMWSGRGINQSETAARAASLCDQYDIRSLIYDASSPGAGIAGGMHEVNRNREAGKRISLLRFVGGAGIPDNQLNLIAPMTDRKFKDFFPNVKSSAWWNLKIRFAESYKAAAGGEYDPDLIISINPKLPNLAMLQNELCQIERKFSNSDRLEIDKVGSGQRSPNLADSVYMLFYPPQYLK